MAPGEKLQLVKRLLNRNPAFSSDSYIAASSRWGPALLVVVVVVVVVVQKRAMVYNMQSCSLIFRAMEELR